MTRIKRGSTANKRRKNILKYVKGFRWGRSKKYKQAKEALMKAWSYSYRDRRNKKRAMRRSWNLKINAGCRENNTKYSDFIYGLKQKNIELDRKILSSLAKDNPKIFSKIVEEVKK